MHRRLCSRGAVAASPLSTNSLAPASLGLPPALLGPRPSPLPAPRVPLEGAGSCSRLQSAQVCRSESGRGPPGREDPADISEPAEPRRGPQPEEEPMSPSARSFESMKEKLLDLVTVKERGDLVDVTLVSLAIAVYVWLSMQLYRVYALMVHMGDDPFR